ncbi:hypothetical protein [Absidia glauca]|uniref:BRCT domain-containing protein n=1 Tax=Absidia glauca TaxID=4829 RepID=A0A163KC35_ABSGL|nr:hypothetical protein [Absidia glauca]
MSSTGSRSPSATIPPPQISVDATSFCLGPNPLLLSKTAKPKPSPPKKRHPIGKRNVRLQSLTTKQQHEESDDADDILTSSNILEGIVIYIDQRSVINKDRLTRVAYALSATVIDKWAPSATHLIHGSVTQQQPSHTSHQSITRTPVLVSKSLDRKMRVVAPAWLMACYDEKKRMPETLYPYEMNSNTRLASLAVSSARLQPTPAYDENPFGLEPDEFARIESCSDDDTDDKNPDPLADNRRMTDYYHRQSGNRNESGNDQGGAEIDMGGFDDDSVHHQINPISDTNSNNNNGGGDGGGEAGGDDVSSMSYSLLEMSQAAPIFRPTEPVSAVNRPPTFNIEHQQRNDTPPLFGSIERTMQHMAGVHEDIQRQRQQRTGGAWTTDRTRAAPLDDNQPYEDLVASSILPEIDPSRLPKVILGREDRMRIWYGEQSFCLDADLLRSSPPPSSSSPPREDAVDLTSNTPPRGKAPSKNKRLALSTSKLAAPKSPAAKKKKPA